MFTSTSGMSPCCARLLVVPVDCEIFDIVTTAVLCDGRTWYELLRI